MPSDHYIVRSGYSEDNDFYAVYNAGHDPHRWLALQSGSGVFDPYVEDVRASSAFSLTPMELLQRAYAAPPKRPGNTVSEFAEWVYSLYRSFKDENALLRGRYAENEIFQIKYENSKQCGVEPPSAPDWHLVHNGMSTPQQERSKSFLMSTLTVNGMPMRGCPDLVFQKKRYVISKSGRRPAHETLVVEIKFTSKTIPADLWPNVWAQL